MRSFAITCVIFLVMIVAVLNNALYISRTIDELITTLRFVDVLDPVKSQLQLQGLQTQWEKEKKYIQASVSHLKVDTVSDLISSLLIYNGYGNRVEYEKTAALLRAALEELQLLEEFSAINIF
jgi:hypothetical protein